MSPFEKAEVIEEKGWLMGVTIGQFELKKEEGI